MATTKKTTKKEPKRKKDLTSSATDDTVNLNKDIPQEEPKMPDTNTDTTEVKKAKRGQKFVDAEGFVLESENGPRKINKRTGKPIMDKPRELSPRTVAKALRGNIDKINEIIALGNAKGLKIELGLNADTPDAPLVLGPIKLEEVI